MCPACSGEYDDECQVCPQDGVPLVVLDADKGKNRELIGDIVDGRYRIEALVGRGGMGSVYRCRHVVVGKTFAIKVLRNNLERSEEFLQRFIREAQAANSIQSRHICHMSDFGQLPNGAFYVVMDLLKGISLTRAMREKKLNFHTLCQVFVQIAQSLDAAHEAGVIHRDLKPDNVVLVNEADDPYFVKLVDFGIAKVMTEGASNLTDTGVILGTPYYMSPEQARGTDVDHRSDIYALGVIMYRAFTGKLPFVADTAMGVLTRHCTDPPLPPSEIVHIDPRLERLILRCLEKAPRKRFQSMSDVASALSAVATTTGRHRPVLQEALATVDDRARRAAPSIPASIPTPTRVATPVARDALTAAAVPDDLQGGFISATSASHSLNDAFNSGRVETGSMVVSSSALMSVAIPLSNGTPYTAPDSLTTTREAPGAHAHPQSEPPPFLGASESAADYHHTPVSLPPAMLPGMQPLPMPSIPPPSAEWLESPTHRGVVTGTRPLVTGSHAQVRPRWPWVALGVLCTAGLVAAVAAAVSTPEPAMAPAQATTATADTDDASARPTSNATTDGVASSTTASSSSADDTDSKPTATAVPSAEPSAAPKASTAAKASTQPPRPRPRPLPVTPKPPTPVPAPVVPKPKPKPKPTPPPPKPKPRPRDGIRNPFED